MFQVTDHFDHLHNDVHFEVFKYLDVSDKIKFERVNTRWQDTLADLLRRQKSVVISEFGVNLGNGPECPNKRHSYHSQDAVAIIRLKRPKGVSKVQLARSVTRKVLSKMPNLKAFYTVCLHNVDDILAELCKNLEHLSCNIRSNVNVNISQLKLSCLAGVREPRDYDFFKQIKFYQNQSGFNEDNVQVFNDNLTAFESNCGITLTMYKQLAIKCGTSLKYLKIHKYTDDLKLSCISQLTNLLGLELVIYDDHNLNALTHYITNLSKLVIFDVKIDNVTFGIEKWFQTFTEQMGGNLQYLGIHSEHLPFCAFVEHVANNCKKLKAISFKRSVVGCLNFDLLIQKLSQLTKLRSVNFNTCFHFLSRNDLIVKQLLKNCPKLRHIRGGNEVMLSQYTKKIITKFAATHPKRKIVVFNSTKIRKIYAENLEFRQHLNFSVVASEIFAELLENEDQLWLPKIIADRTKLTAFSSDNLISLPDIKVEIGGQ